MYVVFLGVSDFTSMYIIVYVVERLKQYIYLCVQ